MIILKNITLKRGVHVLLEKINWTIYPKQKIGIIGHNGSGKSSFFNMLMVGEHIESGSLALGKNIKLSCLVQEISASEYTKTALDFVIEGDDELKKIEAALARASNENNGELIASLHEELNQIDAYSAPSRAAQLLSGLGFDQENQQKLVAQFSGGWQVRLNLAKVLFSRADVLLLDEPTNHLDLDALLWLEDWLVKYNGTLLLISHDRDFLDKIVNNIAYFNNKQLALYTGNYSTFENERANQLITQRAAFEKQQKKLLHAEKFINRFRAKASKAKQAQSRLKMIEKMNIIQAGEVESPFQFEFKTPHQLPHPLLTLEDASIAYDNKIILKHVNLSIAPTDRIALIGPNGAGKTSLIKLLAGELRQSSGKRVANEKLKIGYFAQHQIDQLRMNESPLEHLQQIASSHTELELRNFLGGFDFKADRVLTPVSCFSGGEKSRLALALLVWLAPDLLLLDEPSNHLDLDMRQTLNLALQTYSGAMILISHDRFLMRTTIDQLLLVADQKLQVFNGDVDDYYQWLMTYRAMNVVSTSGGKNNFSKKEQRVIAAQDRKNQRHLTEKINFLEKKMGELQKKLIEIEKKLTDNTLYEKDNKNELKKQILLQANFKGELTILENEWLIACNDRDQLI